MPAEISVVSGPTVPFSALPKSTASAASQPAQPTPNAANPPHASLVSRLDASTGLVVLTFYDAAGDETASLPTKRQLDLYRLNELSPDMFERATATGSVPSKAGLSSEV